MRRFLLRVVVSALVLVIVPTVRADTGLRTVAPSARATVFAPVQSMGFTVGQLEIPSIGVDEMIREGINMDVIDRGVAHWVGTAHAGGYGNMVLAGHRTTKTRPFYDLDLLVPGDEIIVTGLLGQVATYRVSESFVVDPMQIWIADWTDTPTLTLFACHPKGSAKERIIVRADLMGAPLHLP